MSKQGISGLVYLNAGVSLVISRQPVTSPEDFKARKVAVTSTTQQSALQKLGASTVYVPAMDIIPALERGLVDSALIDSARTQTTALHQHGYVLANSLQAKVAIVITRDETWDRLSFPYRAMIGDAAILASQRLDREIVQAEKSLLEKVRSSGKLVSFRQSDAEQATLSWIRQQPEVLRSHYQSALEDIKASRTAPPQKPVPLKGSQLGRIYFATTRDDTRHDSVKYRFGDARTDVVKCGEIVFPSASSPSVSGTVRKPVTSDTTACGRYMKRVLASSEQTVLFVHGFNNRFADAADRAAILKSAFGIGTEVLLWSWPSKRDGLTGDYDYDKESVSGIARHSLRLVLEAMTAGSSAPLDVVAHSMGGWHLIGVLQAMANQSGKDRLRHVALAAPDVPVDEFRFAIPHLRLVATNVTLYACSRDWALALSENINAYPRAGTGGADKIVVNEKLDSIDVEPRLLSSNHSYVFEAGEVLTDLSGIVVQRRDPESRGLRKRPKPPWHYWTFNPQ